MYGGAREAQARSRVEIERGDQEWRGFRFGALTGRFGSEARAAAAWSNVEPCGSFTGWDAWPKAAVAVAVEEGVEAGMMGVVVAADSAATVAMGKGYWLMSWTLPT